MQAPRFEWSFNFGHVLTVATIAGGLIAIYTNMKTSVETLDQRVKALEVQTAQYRPLVEAISIRLGTSDERVSNMAESMRDMRRAQQETTVTLGTVRETLAAISARLPGRAEPR